MVTGESGLDLKDFGDVIIMSVTNKKNVYTISAQESSTTDGLTSLSETSKIGSVVRSGHVADRSTKHRAGRRTIFVTEIFYTFTPATGIVALTKNAINLPSTLYGSAYF